MLTCQQQLYRWLFGGCASQSSTLGTLEAGLSGNHCEPCSGCTPPPRPTGCCHLSCLQTGCWGQATYPRLQAKQYSTFPPHLCLCRTNSRLTSCTMHHPVPMSEAKRRADRCQHHCCFFCCGSQWSTAVCCLPCAADPPTLHQATGGAALLGLPQRSQAPAPQHAVWHHYIPQQHMPLLA